MISSGFFMELWKLNVTLRYNELGPLTEGLTYAFRARAKNSAGYGGYSEIWVVEVI